MQWVEDSSPNGRLQVSAARVMVTRAVFFLPATNEVGPVMVCR
jgi:hypothetical protein